MKTRPMIICCIFCLMAYLSFIFPINIFAENEEELSCEESRIIGEEASKEIHKSGIYLLGGAIIPVGTVFSIAIAATSCPQPSPVPNKPTINIECYSDGYCEAARQKNIRCALVGGLIGTVIVATVYITAWAIYFSWLERGPI